MVYCANVAQSVEQLTRNEQVAGSIPAVGSFQPLIASGAFAWAAILSATDKLKLRYF